MPLLPVLRAEFVYDDQVLIVDRLLRADPPPSLLELATTDLFGEDEEGRPATGYWRPVVSLSYGIERLVYGHHAFGYHLDNVLLHAGACVLLLLVLLRLPRVAPFAFAATLLFAAHPVHLESLAPISGRTDPLGTLLALLAAWWALRGRTAFALVAFAAALGAKESIAALAPVIAALPWLARGAEGRRSSLVLLVGTLLLTGAFFAVKLFALGIVPPPDVWTGEGTVARRFLTFLSALPRYVGLLVWPAELSIVRDVPLATSPTDPWLLGGTALLVVLLAAAGFARAPFAAGALLLLWTLLPASNVVPITYAFRSMPFPFFERYLYVPSIGFALVAAGALAWLGRRAGGGAGAAALAFVVVAFGARGTMRAAEWKSDVTLYDHAARSIADGSFLRIQLASTLFQRGEVAAALRTYDRVLDDHPLHEDAVCGKAQILLLLARDESFGAEQLEAAEREAEAVSLRGSAARRIAEARTLLAKLLEADPRHGAANEQMGMVAIVEEDLLSAARWFTRAWGREGTTPALASNYRLVAERLAADGKAVFAEDDPKNLRTKHFFENAIRALTGSFPPKTIAPPVHDPVVKMLAERADALWAAQQYAQAASGYRVALAFEPELARAYTGLGLSVKEMGDRAGAYEHLRAAIQLDPDAVMALNAMWTMLQEDGREAEAGVYYRRYVEALGKGVDRSGRVWEPKTGGGGGGEGGG